MTAMFQSTAVPFYKSFFFFFSENFCAVRDSVVTVDMDI